MGDLSREIETTKKKLFLAAVRLFAQKGFRDTTVRDICREAGAANKNLSTALGPVPSSPRSRHAAVHGVTITGSSAWRLRRDFQR